MQNYLKKRVTFCLCLCTLLLIGIVLARPAEAQSQAGQVEALVTQYHNYGLFNGAVLVAKGGKVLYKGGFGEANMAWGIPNTPSTKFRIASSTKQFTAALILTLVEAGKLKLDGKITDYLQDYPAAQGERITIHHLLTHTSGIPSYTTPGFMADEVRDPYEPDSLLVLFSDLELHFKPGTRWSYSNSGYILLGAIIEAVTGMSYEEMLRKKILEPVDLDNTGYDHYKEVIKHKATGYTKIPGGYNRAPYLDSSVPYSAGMLYSTVEDLFKWDQLLYDSGPLNNIETKNLLFTSHAALPKGMSEQTGLPPNYGYGWFVGNVAVAGDSVKVIEHGGSIFGFSTGFWRMPKERNTIIIMDNTASGRIRELGQGLMSILYGQEAHAPKQPISDVLHQSITSKNMEAAKARYRKLRKNEREAYDFRESELNRLGYYYLGTDRVELAIEIFKLNVEAYPESGNVYDSLGEAYMEAGNRKQAIANYRKSLELNPGNTNAKNMLKRLGIDIKL